MYSTKVFAYVVRQIEVKGFMNSQTNFEMVPTIWREKKSLKIHEGFPDQND